MSGNAAPRHDIVVPEVMPADEWAGVAVGDTTSDDVLGPVAGRDADFEGDCVACGWEIHVGQPIVLLADGDTWIHDGCVS